MKQDKKYNLEATRALFADDKNSGKIKKVRTTLYIGEDIYLKFKKHCKSKNVVVSAAVEALMKDLLNN